MSRQITTDDISQAFWNGIASRVGVSDNQLYGTDFKDSWINK